MTYKNIYILIPHKLLAIDTKWQLEVRALSRGTEEVII